MKVKANEHLSLESLWAIRSAQEKLSFKAKAHFSECDVCLYLLLLCHAVENAQGRQIVSSKWLYQVRRMAS